MKSIEINATEREDLGSKFARKLRREGKVPCVVYGGEKPVHFYADTMDFRHLVYTANARKAAIALGNQTIEAVVQDIQFHPVSDAILHIDFMQLVADKPATIEVPVTLTGNARGVRSGGKLKQSLRKLSVRALPANLPEGISIDVSDMRIGQIIRVEDVKTDNFEILNVPVAVVASIRMARGAVEEAEEAEEGATAAAEAAEAAAEA
jgi:large subunit ribosomal protein L25